MPEKFAEKFGEKEKPIPEEPSEADETGKPEQKESKELHLSPEEREVVMGKFEEFINTSEYYVRFVYSGELEKYLQRNQFQGEVIKFKNQPLLEEPDIQQILLAKEREDNRFIGALWSIFSRDYTDWKASAGQTKMVGYLLNLYNQETREERHKMRKEGVKEWRTKGRELGIQKVLLEMSKGKVALNYLIDTFLYSLKSVFDGDKKVFQEDMERWKQRLLEISLELKDEKGMVVDKQVVGQLLMLLEQEDVVKYFSAHPKEFRKFINFAYTSTAQEGGLGSLPYQFMLVIKAMGGVEVRSSIFRDKWGHVSQKLDDSLVGVVGILPERTFVQETVQKLREFYDQGKKAEVLFPLFDARLNPRWPNDPEVLVEMKKKIAGIREQVKEKHAEKQKNQNREEE